MEEETTTVDLNSSRIPASQEPVLTQTQTVMVSPIRTPSSGHKKKCVNKWTDEEDLALLMLIDKHGTSNWKDIESYMINGRTSKQCRERWANQLNPSINKGAWTKEEEEVILAAHKLHGNKWAEIAKLLQGRSANSVKNLWH